MANESIDLTFEESLVQAAERAPERFTIYRIGAAAEAIEDRESGWLWYRTANRKWRCLCEPNAA